MIQNPLNQKGRPSMLIKNKLLEKNKVVHDVLNCEIKDETGLNDYQQLQCPMGVAIPKVGITRYRIPVSMAYPDGTIRGHDAVVSMNVSLEANKTGINMSRLCKILQDKAETSPVDFKFLTELLTQYRRDLRDHKDEKYIKHAGVKVQLQYAHRQPSLKSGHWGWQYYPLILEAYAQEDKTRIYLQLDYEYSSTCPCSLSMAKQYEQEYNSGITDEGSGVAVAHGQRSLLRVKLELNPKSPLAVWQILELLKKAIPTETQSLVKRVDEQAFAILNGENPMFVEHASRRIYQVLNKQGSILDWMACIEHYESLHSHNAAAVIFKGVSGGMNQDHLF